jgi:hypothetical protein
MWAAVALLQSASSSILGLHARGVSRTILLIVHTVQPLVLNKAHYRVIRSIKQGMSGKLVSH